MSQTTVAKSKSANDNQATRHVVGKATHTVQRLEECPQTLVHGRHAKHIKCLDLYIQCWNGTGKHRNSVPVLLR